MTCLFWTNPKLSPILLFIYQKKKLVKQSFHPNIKPKMIQRKRGSDKEYKFIGNWPNSRISLKWENGGKLS
jgi:hypothetical protein